MTVVAHTVRVAALLHKPAHRHADWWADAGQVIVSGPTRAAAVEALNVAVRQAVDTAFQRPVVVTCQDGTTLVCWVAPDGCGYDIYGLDGAPRGSCGMAGGMREAVVRAVHHARQSYGGEVALSGTWKWEVERELGPRPTAEPAPTAPTPEEAPTR
jgi:hypothetical protein